jgi:hypothetical protein
MIYQGLLGLVYFSNEDKTKQGSLGDIYLYRIVEGNDCP